MTAPTDDLDRFSRELLERLSREDAGPPAASASHLVGRLVKACTSLEKLLRAAVVFAAKLEGRTPEELVSSEGRPVSRLEKTMAGQLAHGLERTFASRPANAVPVRLGPLVDDLLRRPSTIHSFIRARNEIAKEDGDAAQGRMVSADLKALVLDFRARAGWK